MKKIKKIHPPQIGKNPDADWMLILSATAFLMIMIIAGLGYHFYTVKKFINTGITPNIAKTVDDKKTKEEELKETINIYAEKKATHNAILGNSSSVVEKPQIITSSSTATTSVPAGN